MAGGEDLNSSVDKTFNNTTKSYEDAEQAFNEVDISPEMREYINKVWDQYDISKDGELELCEVEPHSILTEDALGGRRGVRAEPARTTDVCRVQRDRDCHVRAAAG